MREFINHLGGLAENKRWAAAVLGAVFLSICSQPLLAMPSAGDLEKRINNARLCSALPELDVREVAKILEISLPIPAFLNIDLSAKWDKDRHGVREWHLDGGKFRLVMVLGCEPSSRSMLIEALPISATDVRLRDNASCEGILGDDQSVVAIDCRVSGEIGSLIARYVNLEAFITTALNKR